MTASVVLFARPGCHLCEEAREVLRELRAEGHDFELEEVDIDTSDDLLRSYLERIPVIEVGGEIVSELVPDRIALRASLGTVRT